MRPGRQGTETETLEADKWGSPARLLPSRIGCFRGGECRLPDPHFSVFEVLVKTRVPVALDIENGPVHISWVIPDERPLTDSERRPTVPSAVGRLSEPAPRSTSWLKRSVIYHVLIDRFYASQGELRRTARRHENEPVFCGGDLLGIAEKLPYLQELGITALWVSPFTQNAANPQAYHGYHTTDLFQVDARFGGEAGLAALIGAAKRAGIKLILDFVANHVHCDHPFFRDAITGPNSEYRDWFCWDDQGRHLSFLHFRELPKLNLEHPAARQQVIAAASHWVGQGIDGLRCDHALGPSLGFWSEFRRVLKMRAPNVALFGEVAFLGIRRDHLATMNLPNKEAHFLAQQQHRDVLEATMKEYVGVFDGLLDFQFQHLVKTHLAWSRGKPRSEALQKLLDEHYAQYPDSCSLLSFLDNHDQPRFLFEARQRRDRLIAAARLQFQLPQPPVIYYGTEIGMTQAGAFSGDFGDVKCRRMMRWNQRDGEVWAEYRSLIAEWKRRFARPAV